MATAELVRKSPFDQINQGAFEKKFVLNHLLVTALLGGLAYWVYELAPEDLKTLGMLLAGAAFAIAIVKSTIFGFVGLVFAIGLSPDSVMFSSIRLEDFLLPPLLIVWWTKRSANREELVKSAVMSAVYIYLFIAVISTIKGLVGNTVWTQEMAMKFFFKYAQYFVIMWFAMNGIKKREEVIVLLLGSFMACVVVAFIAKAGREAVLDEGVRTFVRAKGPEGETPNVLGGYYLIHLMFAFAMIYATRNYLYRVVLLGFILVVALPLLYTYSRTSFASFFVGLLIICIFVDMRYLLVVGLFAMCHQILLPHLQAIPDSDSFIERYSDILDIFGSEDDKPSSWTARLSGWYVYYTKTVNFDPVFGRGVGSTTMVVDSSFVMKFIETGTLGLLAFVAILVRLGRTAMEVIRQTKDQLSKSFCIGYMGVLSAMTVHAVGVCSFSTIRTAEPFFLFSGVMLAVHVMHQKMAHFETEDQQEMERLRFDR
jgi:hypothetical protein